MGDHVAFGVRAARVLAWILAALPDAGFVLWTIVAEHAFGTTVWWAADVVFNARAYRSTLRHLTNGIRPAWRWRARTFRTTFDSGGRDQGTRFEWIAGFAWLATADRIVIDDFAARVPAANTWARIDASQIDASSGERTLRVGDAFGLAYWRRSTIAGDAGAHSVAGWRKQTTTVGSARRWIAWIDRLVPNRWLWLLVWRARDERVARVIDWTVAHGEMVDHLTLGADAAGADARIHALHIRAGTIQWAVGIDDALRPAADQRIAEVACSADTRQDSVLLAALRVRSALDRITCGGDVAGRCQWH